MGDGVGGVVGSYETMLSATSTRSVSNKMDKDMFFKLLVTQMQNQDPMSPMEDKEFIAQLAQFTSLEQMTQLNETNLQSYAFSLVGKNAIAHISDGAGGIIQIAGRIDTGFIDNGEACFYIGDYLVKGKEITQVFRDLDEAELAVGEVPDTDQEPPEENTEVEAEQATNIEGEN